MIHTIRFGHNILPFRDFSILLTYEVWKAVPNKNQLKLLSHKEKIYLADSANFALNVSVYGAAAVNITVDPSQCMWHKEIIEYIQLNSI